MFKKLVTIGLGIVLIGAVAVGVMSLLGVDTAFAYRGNGVERSAARSLDTVATGNGNQNRLTDPQCICDGDLCQNYLYQGMNGSGNQGAGINQQNQMQGTQGQNGSGYQGAGNNAQNLMQGTQGQNGSGNQGAGNQGQNATGVPQVLADVDEWITVEGTVTGIDLNALTIETAGGESLLVQLGPTNYWNNLGVDLTYGDSVQITGFYEDDTFTAGTVTLLATGETLELRDADGRPLWSGNARSGQGQGRSN